jgi:RimJ/RimL family protein N-acetyltransferase
VTRPPPSDDDAAGPDPGGGPRLATSRLVAVPAGPGAAPELQAVLDAAPAWRRLPEAPPGPDAGADLLADAEADPDRRLWLLRPAPGAPGPWPPGAAGLLDLQLHWPEPGAAHVRLLLVREALQGRGLGTEVAGALAAALGAAGYRALRLSVTDENGPARRFWERAGFLAVGRLEDGVTVYERRLRKG